MSWQFTFGQYSITVPARGQYENALSCYVLISIPFSSYGNLTSRPSDCPCHLLLAPNVVQPSIFLNDFENLHYLEGEQKVLLAKCHIQAELESGQHMELKPFSQESSVHARNPRLEYIIQNPCKMQ